MERGGFEELSRLLVALGIGTGGIGV